MRIRIDARGSDPGVEERIRAGVREAVRLSRYDRARPKVPQIVAQWQVRPFQRGTADCCAFADFVVHALTGKHYIPTYSTDEEAFAIQRKHGGLSGALTYHMGRAPVDAEQLEPGDVAYLKISTAEAIGIVMTPRKVATVLEDGLLRSLPMRFVEHGWKTWA